MSENMQALPYVHPRTSKKPHYPRPQKPDPADIPEGFEAKEIGVKVRCIYCHADGYNVGFGRKSWMSRHIQDHPHKCECGRAFFRSSSLYRHEQMGHPDL